MRLIDMRDKVGITDAAVQLGVSRKTVVRYIQSGKLEAFKYGDNTSPLFVSQSSIDTLIAASRVPGTEVDDDEAVA